MSDEGPARQLSDTGVDDTIIPFEVAALDLRGRITRLGAAVDKILADHDYPTPVAKVLAEAIALCALLGSALKFNGRFILQTQTDGPISLLVVDYVIREDVRDDAPDTAPVAAPDDAPEHRSKAMSTVHGVRAYARFDRARVDEAVAAGDASAGPLLGRGHLAMTVDQGSATRRYQGLVALEGGGLEDAAHEYFLRSEQIPTRVRLAVAEELSQSATGLRHRWRAGGMLLQFLPAASERARAPDLDPGDAPEGTEPHSIPEDDAWTEGRSLLGTVEDLELIDPAVSSERLLYRLFHERGVRVFESIPVEAHCSCSRDKVSSMLRSFSHEERADMIENGEIAVTCEFCNTRYVFDPAEVDATPAE